MSGNRETADAEKCPAETAGYVGLFGVYCELPKGHDGPHNDGHVEWDFVEAGWRNSKTPPQTALAGDGE